MKSLVLLGASGSIGRQTIELVDEHPEAFQLVAVSVHTKLDRLAVLLAAHPSIQHVCLTGIPVPESFRRTYPKVVFFTGPEGLVEMLQTSSATMVVNAITGFAGLRPTLIALENGQDVTLANKESLVTGGELIKRLLASSKASLYPADSEHSALAQCLVGEDPSSVERLILTASGGPFRDLSLEQQQYLPIEAALQHPTWSMGPKITIDSATLMNKGFEVIEAHHLFDLAYDKIEVVIHRESIVHSMVAYRDGAVKAQLGVPSMKTPLLYALNGLTRPLDHREVLSFDQALTLHFEPVNRAQFPALDLAYLAGRKGGTAPAVLNAANEVAVAASLAHILPFGQIVPIVEEVLHLHPVQPIHTYEDVAKADAWARHQAQTLIQSYKEAHQ